MEQATGARSLMDRARHEAFNKLDSQRERAVTGLGSMVDALRESGRQLQGQNATMASYVNGAASQLERFSGGIRERDVHQIVRDVERFARQRPTIFLGSAFALGLVTARFLKSSSPESGAETIGSMPRSSAYSSPTYPTRPSWPDESVASSARSGVATGASSGASGGTGSGAGAARRAGAGEWSGASAGTPAPRDRR